MTIFFLIRHGETDWALNERYKLKGASRDLPCLTENGTREANEVSKDHRLKKAEIILSSPYTRALQTSAIISKNINLDIIVEFDLREWQPDLNFMIKNQYELKSTIEDYERNNGVYPAGISKRWESKELLTKLTLWKVLNKVKMENGAVVAYNHLKVLTLFGKPFYLF
ncbi:MAG: histidine phosphatase family protein, partial [Rickettsia sp.]|nr:histidine phosphatase family protein [Rickettsia sp.]